MCLYLLSKLQGIASRHHPLLLSVGNQSTSGTSAYVVCLLNSFKSIYLKDVLYELHKQVRIHTGFHHFTEIGDSDFSELLGNPQKET